MKVVKTSILPNQHQFAKIDANNELNFKAICIFLSTGFFLDDDTFWKNEICLKPGYTYKLDESNKVISSESWFNWYHEPRNITFEEALDEYVSLLRTIMLEQVGDNKVILPLSGGIDSRSQALVLKEISEDVQSFSYGFAGGFPEQKIARKIADICDFKFKSFTVEKGYLWSVIDQLAMINKCYSEFTHPRQMSVLSELKNIEGIFSLGHWGDVLFDKGASEHIKENLVSTLLKKMVKKDGFALASKLWKHWELEGNLKDYLISRIEKILKKISIENVSSKARAFKTQQWAHRWTTTNLSIFGQANDISLPYYDDRMIHFICTLPEDFLADRKLQIAHIKTNKKLAKITWHANKPFNLYTFGYNKFPYNLPYRVQGKIKRTLMKTSGKPFIQRNFELQFLGKENRNHLESYLFSQEMKAFVPQDVIRDSVDGFYSKDYVYHSHSISMLLTLSLWLKHFSNKTND